MSDCPHTPDYPDLSKVPTLQDAMSRCKLVEDQPEVAMQRALTSVDGVTTRIDSPYWATLDDAQRAAVVAHERAHPEIGMKVNCEGCADKVGGYYMRAWGYAPAVVQHAFSSLRVQRRQDHGEIGANAAAGAQAAERGLAARGLLGKSPTAISAALLAQRAKAEAPVSSKQTQTTSAVPSTTPTTPQVRVPIVDAAIGTQTQGSPPSTDAATHAGVPAASAQLDPGGPNADTPFPALPVGGDPAAPLPSTLNGPPPAPGSNTGGTDVAGDIVASVLGESARPHAVPVLIAAGVGATLAIILVLIVRHASK